MLFKDKIKIELKKLFALRYGENPHQKGVFYLDPKDKDFLAIKNFKKIQGKEFSFNNILDIQGVIDTLCEIENKT